MNSSDLYPAFSKREGQVWHLKERENLTFREISERLEIGRSVDGFYRRAKKKLLDMEITLENTK